ncbi:FAD-dependent oxidoreductase [Jatrophihabitans sp. GAS493]|uniref:FAD-dependent oxidoreductase n=1 Tax=Jatrophihabitans sp. GAS493 TaxID=1907575 RepID=UPI000BB689A5|nr:FAD-dependent oxidoreductase [Jatrophihabitans sp. GAS493]
MALRVAVVGGGVMGSSAAWHLAARGADVTLLEQYPPGHDRGSSHGSSRIFRLAYPDDLYVGLAQRALPLWRTLEEQTNTSLLTLTGAVDHGPAEATGALHDELSAAGARSYQLGAAEAAERWPGLRIDSTALFHPDAGRLHADRAVEALQTAAELHGASIQHGVQVNHISTTETDRVQIVTREQEVLIADAAVVAVGGWAPQTAAPLVNGLPALRVTQEQPAHFTAADALDWPSFIHHPGAGFGVAGGVYGLGSDDGVKVGFHAVGPVVEDAYLRDRSIDPAALAQLQAYAERWLPGVDAASAEGLTCLYTTTPDHNFVIDRQGPITVLAGFSGHGFKFGSVIGELAADLIDGKPGIARFALGPR